MKKIGKKKCKTMNEEDKKDWNMILNNPNIK
jgi:hypothetical protein